MARVSISSMAVQSFWREVLIVSHQTLERTPLSDKQHWLRTSISALWSQIHTEHRGRSETNVHYVETLKTRHCPMSVKMTYFLKKEQYTE